MANGVVEKLVYEIMADFDPKGFNDALKTFAKLELMTMNMVKRMMQFSSALLGAISVENRFTAQQSVVADSLGVSIHLLEGYSTALSGVGVGFEDVAKYMGTFAKKSKGTKKALAELGLSENTDFTTAFDKLLQMDSQKASKYASQLFGADASKALAYAVERGITMADIQSAMDANFLTDEAVEGAKDYNQALAYTYKILRSITKQFSGLLGKYLTPIVKKFNEWLKINKEFISVQLAEITHSLAIVFEMLFSIIGFGVDVIQNLIEAFGGLGTVINMLTLTGGVLFFAKMISMVQLLIVSLPAIKASLIALGLIGTGSMTMAGLLRMGGIFGMIAFSVLALQDIATWMKGGDSYMGDMVGKPFEEWKKDLGTFVEMFKDGTLWTALRLLFGEFVGWIGNVLSASWDSLGAVLDGFIHNLIAGLRQMWNSLPMPDFMKIGLPQVQPLYNPGAGDALKVIRESVYPKNQQNDLMNLYGVQTQPSLFSNTIPGNTKGNQKVNSDNSMQQTNNFYGVKDAEDSTGSIATVTQTAMNNSGGVQ